MVFYGVTYGGAVRKKTMKFLAIFIILIMFGCSSLLPSAKQITRSQWETFDDAKMAFDKIIPYKTTAEELGRLGFDPFSTPNVRILTYLDIIQRFMFNPSIKKEELDEGIQACIDAKNNCRAYEIELRNIANKRYGNFWLDFFNFRRKIKESGWQFNALVVIVNDMVVYKLWGGKPIVDEGKETKNPLGPLQNSGDLIRDLIKEPF